MSKRRTSYGVLGGRAVEDNHANWLPHLPSEGLETAIGNNLDAYVIALEGWRRGLTLKWHAKDDEAFRDMKTWYVDEPGKLFSLSNGVRTHYFFRTRGDKVSNAAVEIGSDKEKTKKALLKAEVPTPEGKSFDKEQRDETIKDYVRSIGYPVVIKPVDGSFGRGVITNIKNEEELHDALLYVRSELKYKEVIAERYVEGKEYRIYVVGDQVVGAINRIPANIVGDGVHTIEQLIVHKNKERMKNPRLISCPIEVDPEITRQLDRLAYTLESIPEHGEHIFLRETSNISQGGDPVDVLDQLPKEVKQTAIHALQAIPDFDHGAVDIIVDENDPVLRKGTVLELNPTAQIGSILFPSKGKARDVPSAIMDYYFPETKGKDRKPNLYFALHDVLGPLKNKTAKSTQLKVVGDQLFAKKVILRTNQEDIDFYKWIKKIVIRLNLHGFVQYQDDGTTSIVIAGFNESDVSDFIKELALYHVEPQIPVKVEDWDNFVKLGFNILGDKQSLEKELNVLLQEKAKLNKEKQTLEKQYKKMVSSRLWKVTKPLRKVMDVVKGK